MKIQRTLRQRMTIQDFAEQHDLTMLVDEYERGFTARFHDAVVVEDLLIKAVYGFGDTEEEAIRRYAEKISGRMLVFKLGTGDRREIQVPVLS